MYTYIPIFLFKNVNGFEIFKKKNTHRKIFSYPVNVVIFVGKRVYLSKSAKKALEREKN